MQYKLRVSLLLVHLVLLLILTSCEGPPDRLVLYTYSLSTCDKNNFVFPDKLDGEKTSAKKEEMEDWKCKGVHAYRFIRRVGMIEEKAKYLVYVKYDPTKTCELKVAMEPSRFVPCKNRTGLDCYEDSEVTETLRAFAGLLAQVTKNSLPAKPSSKTLLDLRSMKDLCEAN